MSDKKLFSAKAGKQISIFLENRPGTLSEVVDLLRKHQVNMLALSLSEGLDVGYVRIIVNNFKKARTVLEANKHLVLVKDVVLLEVANQPGGMASAIDKWAKAGINLEYAYSATGPGTDHSLIVARVNDPALAIRTLEIQ